MSLLAVYSWGGWLVAKGLMPVRLLLSAIGYTFALIFSTQGAIQSTADLRKAVGSIRRYAPGLQFDHVRCCTVWEGTAQPEVLISSLADLSGSYTFMRATQS